jgi:riboflavin kinase
VGKDGKTYQRPMYLVPGTLRTLTGRVFSGSGNCSRNMPKWDKGLGKHLGYEPFPGSLNVRLPEPHALGKPWLDWRPAPRHDRQLWRAWIDSLSYCHAHVPGRRNHGPDTLELIAPVKLRERFGLVDDDEITFDVEVGA